ncbi:hypothetical protein SAMN05443665_10657 [Actinomadura meyerae]|uniref:Uncharacterized protein n=2 Tax=Actinomadura meyerae TaxID=240840 RepID=A0A239P3C5_9ACTN|nr:hypothetical protein SAMN05443665_10657 [Actinomadura meyerae]
MVGLTCLAGGCLVLRMDEKRPYNCDFSCAMSSIGWQDQLAFALFVLGVVALLICALVCVTHWVLSAVGIARKRRR